MSILLILCGGVGLDYWVYTAPPQVLLVSGAGVLEAGACLLLFGFALGVGLGGGGLDCGGLGLFLCCGRSHCPKSSTWFYSSEMAELRTYLL